MSLALSELNGTGNSQALKPYQNTEFYRNRQRSKWRLFQYITDCQYHGKTPEIKKPVILLHACEADGLGDISHLYTIAAKVRKYRPDCRVVVALEVNKDINTIKRLFPWEAYSTQFFSGYTDKVDRFDGAVKKAGCVVGVSLPMSTYLLHKADHRGIREYGYSFHPDVKGRISSMGLRFDEEGLNFPIMERVLLRPLQTDWLRGKELETTYHMYNHEWVAQITALYACAELERAADKHIDIFMPIKHSLMDLVEWGVLNLDVLAAHGIGKVIMATPTKTTTVETGANSQKEMRIISGPVLDEDMAMIQQHSEPFYGCGGDLTFSEAVALNKVPMFYGPDPKKHFIKDLMQFLTNHQFPALKGLLATLEGIRQAEDAAYVPIEKAAPKMRMGHMGFGQSSLSYKLSNPDSVPRKAIAKGLALQLPQFAHEIAGLAGSEQLQKEAAAFDALLQSEYSVDPRIEAIVDRGLILSHHPEIRELETELWEKFKAEELSENQVVTALNAAIDEVTGPKVHAASSSQAENKAQ